MGPSLLGADGEHVGQRSSLVRDEQRLALAFPWAREDQAGFAAT